MTQKLPQLPPFPAHKLRNPYTLRSLQSLYGVSLQPFTVHMMDWAIHEPYFYALIGQHFYDVKTTRLGNIEKVHVIRRVGKDGLFVSSERLDGTNGMQFEMGTNREGQYVTGSGNDPVFVFYNVSKVSNSRKVRKVSKERKVSKKVKIVAPKRSRKCIKLKSAEKPSLDSLDLLNLDRLEMAKNLIRAGHRCLKILDSHPVKLVWCGKPVCRKRK